VAVPAFDALVSVPLGVWVLRTLPPPLVGSSSLHRISANRSGTRKVKKLKRLIGRLSTASIAVPEAYRHATTLKGRLMLSDGE
jgi:hypothetical protein